MSPEEELIRLGIRVRTPPPVQSEAAEPPRFSDVDLALRFAERHASPSLRRRVGQVAVVGRQMLAVRHHSRRLRPRARPLPRRSGEMRNEGEEDHRKRQDRRRRRTPRARRPQDRRDHRSMGRRPVAPQYAGRRGRPAHRPRCARIRPEDYMTKITAVGPGGDCPRFLAFLDQDHGRRRGADRLPSARLSAIA